MITPPPRPPHRSPQRLPLHLGVPAAGLLAIWLAAAGAPLASAPASPRVEAVPTRPAYVKPPAGSEQAARVGQRLQGRTQLRTQTPGRMQVRLADGRSFRLGGDALLRLAGDGLDLERGQIIAWVVPGRAGAGPLRVRTRVATASIEGTTVFIEATPLSVRFFSWEGHVRVHSGDGRSFDLHSGEELAWRQGQWQEPRRLSRQEALTRSRRSLLLNDFDAPMETLPLIRRELRLDDPVAPLESPPPR